MKLRRRREAGNQATPRTLSSGKRICPDSTELRLIKRPARRCNL